MAKLLDGGGLLNKERVYTISFVLSSILAISAMAYSISIKMDIVDKDIKKPISVRQDTLTENEPSFKGKENEILNDKNINSKDNEVIENMHEVTEINENDVDFIENEDILSDNKDISLNNVEERTIENMPVFKVASSEILASLSLLDKEKLLVIGSKLSPLDYARIKEHLYMKDRAEGVKKAVLLLKERLSREDYKKVKDIMDTYINMEVIEKEDEK